MDCKGLRVQMDGRAVVVMRAKCRGPVFLMRAPHGIPGPRCLTVSTFSFANFGSWHVQQ